MIRSRTHSSGVMGLSWVGFSPHPTGAAASGQRPSSTNKVVASDDSVRSKIPRARMIGGRGSCGLTPRELPSMSYSG